VLTLRRNAETENTAPIGPGRRLRATGVSVLLHLLLVLGLWQAIQFPRTIGQLFTRNEAPAPERIQYVVIPPPAVVVPRGTVIAPSVRPVDAEPVRIPEPAPQTPLPQPPIQIPTSIPPPPAVSGPERGPLIGGRGATRGVQPGYTEPRIWIETGPVEAPPLTGDAKLDSAMTARINAYRDSVLANTYSPNKFERGDWTMETKDGKKFGIDKQFIRLGKVSIPTALLGLLPLNQQGNPIAFDRDKRLAAVRAEILEHAQMAMNEEEFRQAVKSIRARKDKERQALLEKKKKEEAQKVISERVPR
jgi:hypothetical protein